METINIITVNNILEILRNNIRVKLVNLNIDNDYEEINKITDTTFKVVLDWLEEYTEDIKLK